MVDLIEAIKEGTDLSLFFHSNLYGSIRYRPISNEEVRKIMHRCIKSKPDEVREFIADIKFRHKPKKDIPTKMIDLVVETLEDMDTWIVYYAVKDFQDEAWQHVHEDGKPLGYHLLSSPNCFLELGRMSGEIMQATTRPKEEIRAFLKTDNGVTLAHAVWKLNVPLSDRLWKLTGIQLTFLAESSGVVNEFKSLDELSKSLGHRPEMATTPEEVNLIQKLEEIKDSL